jgi:osmotically-inducible protein OsmY
MNRWYLSLIALLTILVFCAPAKAQEDSQSNGTTIENGARDLYRGAKGGVEDAAITSKIKADLLSDTQTRHYSIHVDTHGNGIVELSGGVPSRALAHHVVQIAKNVHGVTAIHDNLSVREDTHYSD